MKQTFSVLVLALCFVLCPCRAIEWKPVPPEDLALQKPRVDQAADAEALFWEIWVADAAANNQYPYTVYTHYLRIKIFNDRGAKKYGTVDIEYRGKQYVSNLFARTIEPDGSIQDVSKDAMFDRIVEKSNGRKIHARSFAIPGVRAGSIIEYRRQESHNDELANYVRLPGHMEIPIEHLVYHLKPLDNPYFPYKMRYMPFNMKLAGFKQEPGGYSVSSVDNIPSYQEEPDAPPESQVGAWALIYYDEDRKENPDKYWKSEGKSLYAYYRPFIKVDGGVRQLANTLVAGASNPEDQVVRLYQYCQKNLKDLAGTEVTEAERFTAKNRQTTADTLKRGIGTKMDIRLAFLALATGAGFDARLAYLPDRGSLFFSKSLLTSYFLNCIDVAIKVNDQWRLYDVTTRYLEPGHLRWEEEGEDALITDGKNVEWIAIPVNDPLASTQKRSAMFHLDEQGNLEGDLTEILTGHAADDWRWQNQEHSAKEQEKSFEESLERRLPGIQVSNISLSDPNVITQPVTMKCHLKVDNYATRTGKRLFLDPAFFEFNMAARYPESVRRYDVTWRYPWSEIEDVSVQIPPGFALDHADAPGGVSFEPVGKYDIRILKISDTRILYHRELVVGKGGVLGVPQAAYPNLKKIFDLVHDRDNHMLTLKVQPPVAASAK